MSYIPEANYATVKNAFTEYRERVKNGQSDKSTAPVAIRRSYTTGDYQKIRDLRAQGKSHSQIAQELGFPRTTVSRVLRDPDAKPGTRKRVAQIPDLDRQGIVRAKQSGKSTKEVALMYGIGESTVNMIFRKDTGKNQINHLSDRKKKDICRYYRMGWTLEKIAGELGIPQGTVSSYISKQGLSNRQSSHQNKELLMAPLRLDGTPDIRPNIENMKKVLEHTSEELAENAPDIFSEHEEFDPAKDFYSEFRKKLAETTEKVEKEIDRVFEAKEEMTLVDILTIHPALVVETERKVNVRGRFGMYCVRNGLFDMEMFTAGDAAIRTVDDLKALADELAGAYEILKKEV